MNRCANNEQCFKLSCPIYYLILLELPESKLVVEFYGRIYFKILLHLELVTGCANVQLSNIAICVGLIELHWFNSQ